MLERATRNGFDKASDLIDAREIVQALKRDSGWSKIPSFGTLKYSVLYFVL